MNGSGFSIDLGIAMDNGPWQFGAALTDIGFVRYSSNTELYTQEILSNIREVRTQDYRGFGTIRQLVDQIQQDLNLSPRINEAFTIGLPAKATLFADYTHNNKLSFSAVLHQRIPVQSKRLHANNLLVITPRYELGPATVFVPLTFLEYSSFRMGTAVQVGPLVIGSDHLSSVLFSSDFNGSDIYFSLNIYPFGQPAGNSRSKGKSVFCPDF